MKRSKIRFSLLTGAVAFIGISDQAFAEVKPNPYDGIVERNPFGLKPPPPPPDPSTNAPPAPVTPPAQVEVTGFLSVLSSKKVLLEVIPAPGKPMLKPVLSEGERIESVEVLAINVEKNEVTIKNGNAVTNLTFKVAKSTGPTAPPPPVGVVPPPHIATPMPAPVQTSYNQSQGSGRYAVMMAGGSTSTPPPANPAAPSSYGGSTAFGNPGAMGAPAAAAPADGFRQIPSRNIRTAATPQTGNEGPVTRQQTYQQMQEIENNRLKNTAVDVLAGRQIIPPLPPTPLTPPDAGAPPLPTR
jgi:hypothetical protein